MREPLRRAVCEGDVARCPPSRSSFYQKRKSDISPSQKTGAEIPKSAKPIATRSMTIGVSPPRSRRSRPRRSSQRPLPRRSESVRGARSMIWSLTGTNVVVRVAEARPAVLVADDEVLDEIAVLRVERLVEAEVARDQREFSGVGCLPAKRSAGSPGRQHERRHERDRTVTTRRRGPSRRAGVRCRSASCLLIGSGAPRGRPGAASLICSVTRPPGGPRRALLRTGRTRTSSRSCSMSRDVRPEERDPRHDLRHEFLSSRA